MRLLAVFLLLLISTTGAAQPFPSKPIRCIVPSSPGGGADTTARLVAAALPAVLGEQVIVENRAGASGNIGTAAAAKSPPDGYTWLLINNAQAANATLQKDPGFDLLRDFAPVTQVDSSPHIVLVHPSVRQPRSRSSWRSRNQAAPRLCLRRYRHRDVSRRGALQRPGRHQLEARAL